MKLAILGGSFNPFHVGHLFLADTVLSELHYDRVVLVPAYRSPFKLSAAGMEDSAHDRLAMAAASIAGDPRLTVDDCEIRREGISYTVDTIADIIRRYIPEGKPGLVIGDDLAGDLPNWHECGQILAMADIIIARRVHSEKPKVPYPCTFITNNVMEISSRVVREKIAEGGAWRSLVPAGVRAIIEDHRLYGFRPQNIPSRPDETGGTGFGVEMNPGFYQSSVKSLVLRIEETVRQSLSFERFVHSRNTALLAWDMCRRFPEYQLDPDMGYLAGIAHDLGKRLGEKELFKLAKNDDRGISELEKEKPSLLHGRAAAVLLRERFNVHNEDVLEAIALHTAGGKNMGPLAKVVYIADKMEVSREKDDPAVRKLAYTGDDLEMIFGAVLHQTVSWLRSKKLKLAEETLKLLEKTKGIS